MNRSLQKSSGRQAGVTLVEIMISLVLGLLLLGGIVQVFLGSKQVSRTQEALTEIQENGRYALEIFSRDLRLTGFKGGCHYDATVNSLLNPTGMGGNFILFDLNEGVRGWDGIAGPDGPGPAGGDMFGYVANTDAILIKHAAIRTDAIPDGGTDQDSEQVDLISGTRSGIPRGAIVVVSDVDACDQFQNSVGSGQERVGRSASTGSAPGNLDPTTNDFSKTYDDRLVISRFRSAVYYVGDGAFAGQPSALRRVMFDLGAAQDEQIAQGLVDLQVMYGVDTNGDRGADQYLSASAVADWGSVAAIRVNMLFASTENNVVQAPMTLAFNGGIFNAPDRRMYQVFSTTVGVRNSLP
ncbi:MULTISPECIES: PilW family protein [unclassified Ectothiorhodospira]|uniref:PilW family protein n=1 Tax=unclassified Ectothiorhodospira TaxID=2684909 RepID=UPI001EE9498B|nr:MULTISPECIES: PilW family protein [unclassified Ectothiorhodospira]MCG5517021.1 PilW family protein [Ectothiorhodospira sp. 9100]MCG5520025.1 PilW family protein [Ectothiorhodospira sp. 9905]